MNRHLPALLVCASLLISGHAWAGPQGKGHAKHAQTAAKQAKADGKEDRKEAKQAAKDKKDGRNATIRFSGLDLNGDRMITRNEWRGSDASFRANDWNRDGVLSGDEVRPDARRPEQFSRKDWRGDFREFDRADTNHDGVLTAEEFARWR